MPSASSPLDSALESAAIAGKLPQPVWPAAFQKFLKAAVIAMKNGDEVPQIEPLQITAEERAQGIKRVNKVRHIMAELVNTEEDWRKDLSTVRMLYMQTALENGVLEPSDVRTIFGNWLEIVELCNKIKRPMISAVSHLYYKKNIGGDILPRDWDTMILEYKYIREIQTSVGAFFLEIGGELGQVYGKYIFNQPASSNRLEELKENERFQQWLQLVKEAHKDISHAWDLPAFLVKPLQRLTKYPLLLKSLLAEMPETHPDYKALNEAIKKLDDEIHKINTRKARLEMLERVKNGEMFTKVVEKKKTGWGWSSIPGFKLFSKKSEKFSLKKEMKKKKTDKELAKELRIMAKAEDVVYQKYAQKFGAHFFQIQIVIADMGQYLADVREFANWFMELSTTLVALAADNQVADHTHIVSKWIAMANVVQDFAIDGADAHVSPTNPVASRYLIC